eukprot:gene6067-7557_t
MDNNNNIPTSTTPTTTNKTLPSNPFDDEDFKSKIFHSFLYGGPSDLLKLARPTPPTDESTEKLMNSCIFHSVRGSIMGAGIGFLFGVFFATSPMGMGSLGPEALSPAPTPLWKQVVDGFKDQGRNGLRSAKNMAGVMLIYSGAECAIEKARGRDDRMNPLYAGCTTGALIAARAGPQAAVGGCIGFALFGAMMDHFFQH